MAIVTDNLYLDETFEEWRKKLNNYSDKLTGIQDGANYYVLPTASSDTKGGIKVGSGLAISDGILSVSSGSSMRKWQFKTEKNSGIQDYDATETYTVNNIVKNGYTYYKANTNVTKKDWTDTNSWSEITLKFISSTDTTTTSFSSGEYAYYTVGDNNFLCLCVAATTTKPTITTSDNEYIVSNTTYWNLVKVLPTIQEFSYTNSYATNDVIKLVNYYLCIVDTTTGTATSNTTYWSKINIEEHSVYKSYAVNDYVYYKKYNESSTNIYKCINSTNGSTVDNTTYWNKISSIVLDTIKTQYTISGQVTTTDTSFYMCFYGSTLLSGGFDSNSAQYTLSISGDNTLFTFTDNFIPTEENVYVSLYYFQSGSAGNITTKATENSLGTVIPDGDTIKIDSNGVISVNNSGQEFNGKYNWSVQTLANTTEYTLSSGEKDFPSSNSEDYLVFYDSSRLDPSDYVITLPNTITINFTPTKNTNNTMPKIIIEYFYNKIHYSFGQDSIITNVGSGLKVIDKTLFLEEDDFLKRNVWRKTAPSSVSTTTEDDETVTSLSFLESGFGGFPSSDNTNYTVYLDGIRLDQSNFRITKSSGQTIYDCITFVFDSAFTTSDYAGKKVVVEYSQNCYSSPLSIKEGGTGSTTQSGALSALGALGTDHATATPTSSTLGHVYIDSSLSNTASNHVVPTSVLYTQFNDLIKKLNTKIKYLETNLENSTPIGSLQMYAGYSKSYNSTTGTYTAVTPPTGWLWCDGAECSIIYTESGGEKTYTSGSDYIDLFNVIGFRYGGNVTATTTDGITTTTVKFSLPNLSQRVPQGISSSEENTASTTKKTVTLDNVSFGTIPDAGLSYTSYSIKSAGLPNIVGYHGIAASEVVKENGNNNYSGAFTASDSTTYTERVADIESEYTSGIKFDASLYNSIYGNSTTVQPPSILCNFIIKYKNVYNYDTNGTYDNTDTGTSLTLSTI